MLLRNKTMDRSNKIARSGTRFSVKREQGDSDIFKTAMIYTPNAAFFSYTLPASMTLISKSKSFGHSLIGTGDGYSLITASQAPYEILKPHDMECQIAVYTPDTITLDGSGNAPYLNVPVFGVESQWITVTYGSAQINVSYTAPDGDTLDLNFYGNKFGLKFRVARTHDGYFNIGVFNNGWHYLNRKPIKFDPATETNLAEFEFAGRSTLSGNGSFEIQSYTSFPVIIAEGWDDRNVTRMPMCISYTDTEAVFDSYPTSFGTFAAYIQGYTSTDPFTVSTPSFGQIEDLEAVFDLEKKENPSLMVSQIKSLYSNSEPNVCPVQGESTNEVDAILANRCFEDDSDSSELSKEVSLSVSKAGDTKSFVDQAQVVMQKDGYTYGKDLDLRKIHIFDEAATLAGNFFKADVLELALTETVTFNAARSKTFSNDRRIYYGTYAANSATDTFTPVRISFNLDIKYLQSEQATVPNEIIDGTNFNIQLASMEEPTISFTNENVDVGTNYTLIYDLPKGHYSLSISPGVEVSGIDTSLFGLVGQLTVEAYDPSSGGYTIIVSYNVFRPQISFGGNFQIRFDLKPFFGYGWFYIYDPATSSIIKNTLSGPTTLFKCATTTDSISCAEMPDGFAIFYIPTTTEFQGSTIDLVPVNYGISNTINYIRYDFDGNELNRGLLQLDNDVLGTSYIHAFDVTNAQEELFIAYSIRNDRLQTRSTRVSIGTKTYLHPRICSTSYPFIQPSVYTKSMRFDVYDFTQNEIAPSGKGEVALQSLNNILSSYRIESGAADAKGTVSINEDYVPNHQTGAAFIRIAHDKYINQTALSVIDSTFRLPLVLSGNKFGFREVAIPPLFSLQSFVKTATPPLLSIDACYGIDGYIWTVGSTLALRAVPGSESSGYKLQTRFEVIPLSAEILSSNRTTFLNKEIGSNWETWTNVSAYKPLKNFLPMPILNQSDDVIEYQFGEHTLNPNADASLSFTTQPAFIPAELRSDMISISSDKQMLVIGQSGSLSKPPSYFQLYHFDRMGFNVPCDRHFDSGSAYYTTFGNFLPGKLNITDLSAGASRRMNHIRLDFTDDARLEYSTYQSYNSTRNRFSSLNTGARHKIVFTADELDADGVSIFIIESYSDPTDTANPPDAILASVQVDLYRIGNILHFNSLTSSGTFGTSEIDITNEACFELHCCLIRSSPVTYDIATIMKRAEGTWDSFKNDSSSYLDGSAPFINQDNYSKYYYKDIWKHEKTNEEITVSATDPVQLFSINSAAGNNPDCAMNLLYYQVGTLIHDGLLLYLPSPDGRAYIENYKSIQAGESPIRSDVDIIDKRVDKTLGIDVFASPNSKEFYLTSGFSARPIASYLATTTFSLLRSKINTANSAKSSDLHGRWISGDTSQAIYLWVDANDSNMDKLMANHVAITGANFSQFFVVAKDTEESDWQRIAYFDTRVQGYTNLSTTGLNTVNLSTQLVPNTGGFRKLEPQSSPDSLADRLLEFSGLPSARGFDVYASANAQDGTIFYRQSITPNVFFATQRLRDERNLSSLKVVSINDDKLAANVKLTDTEKAHISIFNEDFHANFSETTARFIGIEIPPQETYEGYYTLNVLDIGKSTKIGIKFAQSDDSGISYNYNIEPQYMIDNVGVDGSYKIINKSYTLEYQASDKLDFMKLKSAVDRIALSNYPIWVFETDRLSGTLCLAEGSPEYNILLDDRDKKIYMIKLKLTVVR